MSATLIDDTDDKSNDEEFEFKAVEEQPTEPEQPPQEDIPEKYKGKSIQDIIEMHQNAEKLAGRQSSEVGELRKIVDDFITSQSQSVTQTQQPEEEFDFLDNPEEAVKRAVDSHPAVTAAKKLAEETEVSKKVQQAQDELLKRHPDTSEILQNPKFAEWIQAKESRQTILRRANESNDVDSMSFLFDEFKDDNPVSSQTSVVSEQQAQAKRSAQTGAVSSGGGTSKKVYRRADIIKLMQTDRDRYEQLSPEIDAAYREGRVIS